MPERGAISPRYESESESATSSDSFRDAMDCKPTRPLHPWRDPLPFYIFKSIEWLLHFFSVMPYLEKFKAKGINIVPKIPHIKLLYTPNVT